ncbi:MAG: hypothetical protein WAO35_20455 [Terriglobia bacterium]
MHVNTRVQQIWLRLLGAVDSSLATRIEMIEDGYYAVVHDAAKRTDCDGTRDQEDFRAVESFIPNLDRTRAVYLNQESNYGLTRIESLQHWAGPLGEQVEQGARHAFAIVEVRIFIQKVSASLRASGWQVEHVEDSLRVSDGRFTECVNLLRAVVQMVFSRSTFADAARSLEAQLAGRFLMNSRLFARFEGRFAHYRPAIIGRYFTLCPNDSRLAAGWDYWQISSRDARAATEDFEQAMKEFEALLSTPQENWLPPLPADCCEQSTLNLEVIHD